MDDAGFFTDDDDDTDTDMANLDETRTPLPPLLSKQWFVFLMVTVVPLVWFAIVIPLTIRICRRCEPLEDNRPHQTFIYENSSSNNHNNNNNDAETATATESSVCSSDGC